MQKMLRRTAKAKQATVSPSRDGVTVVDCPLVELSVVLHQA